MHPKADEFILDVRRTARTELKPTVTTDSQMIDPDFFSRVLERAMLWLTPKIVENYDPVAFEAWPSDLQAELHDAVERFRAIASAVPGNKPATTLQARDGVEAFSRLKDAVKKVALSEWLEGGSVLINKVEAWAKQFKWNTRRQPKKLNEFLLGAYELDQLYIYAEDSHYILDPVARFNPGGLGTFDLSIQPSFEVTSVYRYTDGIWYIHLDVGHGVRGATTEEMSPAALESAVGQLRMLV